MTYSFLLVHSPLVGPASWSDVATVALAAGYKLAVPDLTAVATTAQTPRSRTFVDLAADAGSELEAPVVVVGHSGAGVMLPLIAAALGPHCSSCIFVDAVVPVASGEHGTAAEMVGMLDEMTSEGLLRRWLTWWPDDVVAELLPDVAQRDRLLADMPRVPRDFFDEAVPVPEGWVKRSNGYLQLSEAYELDRAEADAHGWPTDVMDGTHLSIATHPAEVFVRVQALIAKLGA